MVTTGLTIRHQLSALLSKATKIMRIHRNTVLIFLFSSTVNRPVALVDKSINHVFILN